MCAPQLHVYEMPKGKEELRLAGKLSLEALHKIVRDRPNSDSDFTFRIVTRDGTIRLDPGSRERFQSWQEGLMAAVAVPSPAEQRRKIESAASGRIDSPPSPPPVY